MELIGFGDPIANHWPTSVRVAIFPPMPKASEEIGCKITDEDVSDECEHNVKVSVFGLE